MVDRLRKWLFVEGGWVLKDVEELGLTWCGSRMISSTSRKEKTAVEHCP